MAYKKGNPKPAGSGRKRGARNKKTIDRQEEFKLVSDKLFMDQSYLKKVVDRITRGRAQQLEKFIWEKRFGKEPLPIELTDPLTISHKHDVTKRLAKYASVFDKLAKASLQGAIKRDDS